MPLHVALNEQKEVGWPGLSLGNVVRLRVDVFLKPCCGHHGARVLTRTGAAKHAFTLLAITTPRPINSL